MNDPNALDETDEALLSQLQRNSRSSLSTMAMLGRVSEDECRQRIARLETAGHIIGYTIVRGYPDAATRPRVAILRVHITPGRTGHDVIRSLLNIPEVITHDIIEVDGSLIIRLHIADERRLEEIQVFFLCQASVARVEANLAVPTIDIHRDQWPASFEEPPNASVPGC